MTIGNLLNDRYLFTSDRLSVCNCELLFLDNQNFLAEKAVELLTPQVVNALPTDWQGIETPVQALSWLRNRLNESHLLAVNLKQSNEIIGFIFIHEREETKFLTTLNIGYLFGNSYWGKGYASEILSALVSHYKTKSNVSTLFAGVKTDNVTSIKVLEKCGFQLSKSEMAPGSNLFYELRLQNDRL
jgi:ribosomal-protein-alanine N-acetyltransferase